MRLIDADHLTQIVCGATILPDGFKDVFRKLVAGEPTVDRPTRSQFKRMAAQLGYEKVVHCEDCMHYREQCVCDYHAAAVCADWFCWNGEMKADADEPDGT